MKKFKKLNSFLKKYQPTIQTLGILLILASVLIAMYQNKINQNQLELTIREKLEESQPKLSISTKVKKGSFVDELVIKNENPQHTLKNVKLFFLDGIKLMSIPSLNNIIKTSELKFAIKDVAIDYVKDYDMSFGEFSLIKTKSEVLSYPIVISYKYFENKQIKTSQSLYHYKMEIYFFRSGWRIKTVGLELIKPIDPDSKNIYEALVSNLLEKPLFGNAIHRENLKIELTKSSRKYADIIEYMNINLMMDRYIQGLVLIDESNSDTINIEAIYRRPSFFRDSIILKDRLKILQSILNQKNKYGDDIINQILIMEDSSNMFTNRKIQLTEPIPLDSKQIDLFENHEESWIRLNQTLMDSLVAQFSISDLATENFYFN